MDQLKAREGESSAGPKPTGSTTTATFRSSIERVVIIILAALLLILLVRFLYRTFRESASSKPATTSDDLTPSELDGKKRTTLAASKFPVTAGSDYGLQFWLYVKDWNFRFGQEKTILSRGSNPVITLHPTDNSLNVRVAIYPSSTATAGATPAPAGSAGATGDVYTCTVENIPLQAWFAVSVTVFQRNLDIYINGQLVKSCVLPGVPKLSTGPVNIGGTNGFSGSFCNLKYTPRGLVPADAMTFYSEGTTCGKPGAASEEAPGVTIFGYTFRFSLFKRGKTDPIYTLG